MEIEVKRLAEIFQNFLYFVSSAKAWQKSNKYIVIRLTFCVQSVENNFFLQKLYSFCRTNVNGSESAK